MNNWKETKYQFNKIYTYNGKQFKRINRKKVDNLLQKEKNIMIYAIPCKSNFEYFTFNWMPFGMFEVEKNQYCDYYDCINQLAEISYYNCDKETGSYLAFFIEV